MIYRSVPDYLDALRGLTREAAAALIPYQNPDGTTTGYQVGVTAPFNAFTFEVPITVLTDYYSQPTANEAEVMARYRADLRKNLPFSRHDVVLGDPELLAKAERLKMPTAWDRLLDGDE